MWDAALDDSQMFTWPYQIAAPRRGDAGAAVRRVRRGARRLGTRRRAVHVGAGQPVRLVARAHARRPHQPLGAHLAALRPRRLPPQEPRRPRRRLADHLRRRQAVLRQDRRFIGIFGTNAEGFHNEPDGIFLPPPKPRCYELLIKKACRQAERSRACRRGCRSSRSRSTAGRPATTAASAAAAARRTRTSRRRRC